VHSDRKADGRPRRPHTSGRNELRFVGRTQNAEYGGHPGLLRASDHGLEVANECRISEMTVAVDHC
jgi:hypothetical protein